ncbi:hypothetical protein EDD32_0854 [Georgenia muralis]|uniref:Uncharacterized protein n=1 Tax=Georgenia muralis TaxID=154117 RepID=A0A3N4ZZC2_9MICO|nr:hypothetical protein EDD32_0854 [Georgenia muralis]
MRDHLSRAPGAPSTTSTVRSLIRGGLHAARAEDHAGTEPGGSPQPGLGGHERPFDDPVALPPEDFPAHRPHGALWGSLNRTADAVALRSVARRLAAGARDLVTGRAPHRAWVTG